MFKFLSSAVVLLASSAALAYPAVGDYSMMSGNTNQNGVSSPFTLERTIKSFDATAQQYVVSETQTIGGQAQTADTVSKADELLTQEQVQQALSFCTVYGGTAETITVKAGTFPTCALPMTDNNGQPIGGTAWVGDVTFGIVKVIGVNNGVGYVLELDSAHAGN